MDAVRPRGLDRPWSRAIPDEPQYDLIQTGRPPQNRPVDATPAEADLQPEDQ
jgi:competence protein ComEC